MNCYEYAQSVLIYKPLKKSTSQEYLSVCRSLKMDQIEYPPNASQLTNLLKGVFNINIRRKCAIAIESIYGIKVKVPSPVPLQLGISTPLKPDHSFVLWSSNGSDLLNQFVEFGLQ